MTSPSPMPAPAPSPGVSSANPRTVFGIPLRPDERVIFFHRISRDPLVTGMVGVLLLPVFLLGVVFILKALRMREQADWAQVITNKRIFSVNGLGAILREKEWSTATGVVSKYFNGALQHVMIGGANNANVYFNDKPSELAKFFKGPGQNSAAFESLPEVSFEPGAPRIIPGHDEKRLGIGLAAFGGLAIVVGLVAISDGTTVFFGLLFCGAGALLIRNGNAKLKTSAG